MTLLLNSLVDQTLLLLNESGNSRQAYVYFGVVWNFV